MPRFTSVCEYLVDIEELQQTADDIDSIRARLQPGCQGKMHISARRWCSFLPECCGTATPLGAENTVVAMANRRASRHPKGCRLAGLPCVGEPEISLMCKAEPTRRHFELVSRAHTMLASCLQRLRGGDRGAEPRVAMDLDAVRKAMARVATMLYPSPHRRTVCKERFEVSLAGIQEVIRCGAPLAPHGMRRELDGVVARLVRAQHSVAAVSVLFGASRQQHVPLALPLSAWTPLPVVESPPVSPASPQARADEASTLAAMKSVEQECHHDEPPAQRDQYALELQADNEWAALVEWRIRHLAALARQHTGDSSQSADSPYSSAEHGAADADRDVPACDDGAASEGGGASDGAAGGDGAAASGASSADGGDGSDDGSGSGRAAAGAAAAAASPVSASAALVNERRISVSPAPPPPPPPGPPSGPPSGTRPPSSPSSEKVHVLRFGGGDGERLRLALLEGPEFRQVREALEEFGHRCVHPSRAIVLVKPRQFAKVEKALESHELHPFHVVISETLEYLLEEILASIPCRRRPRQKTESRRLVDIASAAGSGDAAAASKELEEDKSDDEKDALPIVERRTFLCEAPVLRPARTVAQSTTEAVLSCGRRDNDDTSPTGDSWTAVAKTKYLAHYRGVNPRRPVVKFA